MKNEEYEREIGNLSIGNSVEEYRPGELYTMVSKCIENYVAHYGEKPTPEMVSDILEVPVAAVEEIMKANDATKSR